MTALFLALALHSAPAAEPPSWAANLAAQRALLRLETKDLESAVATAKTGTTSTRESLEREIEDLTRTLTRLRAENASRTDRFADRERSQVGASQVALVVDVVSRAGAWASSRRIIPQVAPASSPSADDAQLLFASVSRALANRTGIRAQKAEVFGADGTGKLSDIIEVGPVGAFVLDNNNDAAAIEPLEGTDGWHRVGPRTALLATGETILPPVVLFDPDEPHEHTPPESRGLVAWLGAGGLVMYPLFLMGLIAALIALERAFVLLGAQRHWWRAFGREGMRPQLATTWALAPLRVLQAFRGTDPALQEERVVEAILRFRTKVRARLSVLAIIAGAAPLLGLLGTVTGMIGTFRVITEHGTGDPELLSGGIAQALLTTQLGLAVAIPTLLAHAGLNRWTQRLVSTAELAALEVVHQAADEAGRAASSVGSSDAEEG